MYICMVFICIYICRFFVVAMAIACVYLALSIAFSIVCIIRPHAAGPRLLLIFFDIVSPFINISGHYLLLVSYIVLLELNSIRCVVAGDACFDHCSGWIIRGHSLLGSQRKFKRELVSDLPAIRQLLPEDQRSRGGIIRRDAWLHVLGSVICRCSEKTLRRYGADSYHHELVLAVHNCAFIICMCLFESSIC